jgi:2-C-methyl-D-erythritol 2,4-cyclodiphosphate synthase
MIPFRIGFGFDVHRLEDGRDFWLGGVKVDHGKGAVGHSDADVVLHAICDALLGAAALGDIGVHFPDTSNEFKGIDSKILLQRSVQLIRDKGYVVGNVDVTLALQAPKIKPYIPAMIDAIAPILGVSHDAVSIKATTTEKLGYVGSEDGVNAYAVALIYKG